MFSSVCESIALERVETAVLTIEHDSRHTIMTVVMKTLSISSVALPLHLEPDCVRHSPVFVTLRRCSAGNHILSFNRCIVVLIRIKATTGIDLNSCPGEWMGEQQIEKTRISYRQSVCRLGFSEP